MMPLRRLKQKGEKRPRMAIKGNPGSFRPLLPSLFSNRPWGAYTTPPHLNVTNANFRDAHDPLLALVERQGLRVRERGKWVSESFRHSANRQFSTLTSIAPA